MAPSKTGGGGGAELTHMQQLIVIKDTLLKKVEAFMDRHPQATLQVHAKKAEKVVNVPAPALFIAGSSMLVLLLVLLLSLEGVA